MRISVAMATFNGARFVEQQIASIAAQSRLPDELVVCDDRSSDDTIARVSALALPFPVRLSVNPQRLGSTANFERAICLCSGDVIALSDQDDIWAPDKLALLGAAFAADPALGLAFSDARLVRKAGNPGDGLVPVGRGLWHAIGFDARRQRRLRRGNAAQTLFERSIVTGATMAFRSIYRPLVVPFPTAHGMYIHDRWIATLIAAVARIQAIPRPLIDYRQHDAQQIGAPDPAARAMPALGERRRGNEAALIAEVAALRALEQRLAEGRAFRPDPSFMEVLHARVRHFNTRLALPAPVPARLAAVGREVASGRYARHSLGLLSALKDVFVE